MSNDPFAQGTFTETQHPQDQGQLYQPKSKTGCLLWGVGGGCLFAILACAGLAGIGVVGLFAAIKMSEPYTESLQRAQASDEVAGKVGQPIEPGFMVQGNINFRNNDGDANLSYAITGPDGEGTVNVSAEKTDGVWEYDVMNVTTNDGTVIDLRENESLVDELADPLTDDKTDDAK